jgi:hypothetical protein
MCPHTARSLITCLKYVQLRCNTQAPFAASPPAAAHNEPALDVEDKTRPNPVLLPALQEASLLMPLIEHCYMHTWAIDAAGVPSADPQHIIGQIPLIMRVAGVCLTMHNSIRDSYEARRWVMQTPELSLRRAAEILPAQVASAVPVPMFKAILMVVEQRFWRKNKVLPELEDGDDLGSCVGGMMSVHLLLCGYRGVAQQAACEAAAAAAASTAAQGAAVCAPGEQQQHQQHALRAQLELAMVSQLVLASQPLAEVLPLLRGALRHHRERYIFALLLLEEAVSGTDCRSKKLQCLSLEAVETWLRDLDAECNQHVVRCSDVQAHELFCCGCCLLWLLPAVAASCCGCYLLRLLPAVPSTQAAAAQAQELQLHKHRSWLHHGTCTMCTICSMCDEGELHTNN